MTIGSTEICRNLEELLLLVNIFRDVEDLPALELSVKLIECAMSHTYDQIDYIGHTCHIGSDGSFLGDRLRRIGYTWSYAVQNLASGQHSAADVMRSWMNSPSHRRVILEDRAVDMGMYVEEDEKGMKYWTQIFAAPSSK